MLVDFLQEDKVIYCVVVETFCGSVFLQICEPLEALTWDAEGEVLLGRYGDSYNMFNEAVIIRG